MAPKVEEAELGLFVAADYGAPGVHLTTDDIFKFDLANPAPKLKKGRKNRILLYQGAFNPPHHGHLTFLQHVYNNSQDLNAIAAFVVPRSDTFLQHKYRHNPNERLFTKEQRIKLWRGYDMPHPWYFVYGGDDGVSDFCDGLVEGAREDGFELEFISILGPDNVERKKTKHWDDFSEISIVSNASRSAESIITNEDGSMIRLKGFEPWEPMVVNKEEMQRRATEKAENLRETMSGAQRAALLNVDSRHFETLAEHQYDKELRIAGTIQECRRKKKPSRTVRFIPADPDINSGHTSATEIREKMAGGIKCVVEDESPTALDEAIGDLVLHPQMVIEMCCADLEETTAVMSALKNAREAQEQQRALVLSLPHLPSAHWTGQLEPLEERLRKSDASQSIEEE